MRQDKLSKQNLILYACGIIPVVWLALLIAPAFGGDQSPADRLPNLIENLGTVFNNPFHIEWCEDSLKTVLIFILAYGMGIGIYLSTIRNYRRREEHGSAKWGVPGTVNKKYADREKTQNKILTQNVAIGLDGSRLDIVLMQMVNLMRDGQPVRMSKRTGKAISLTDLLDEIPVDACRWFFNAKPETQMEFDLGLAVREDSENPVYYVQYAYARICTLVKALAAEGYTVPAAAEADLSVLIADEEKALIKQIAQYCDEIKLAARDYDPSHINRCLQELAGCFHRFYTACRIRGEEPAVAEARMKLADDTRIVLKNGLRLIGVDAPEKM